eukprot:6365220-Heterocapsa_arctica.AAC.1
MKDRPPTSRTSLSFLDFVLGCSCGRSRASITKLFIRTSPPRGARDRHPSSAPKRNQSSTTGATSTRTATLTSSACSAVLPRTSL